MPRIHLTQIYWQPMVNPCSLLNAGNNYMREDTHENNNSPQREATTESEVEQTKIV